MSLFEPHTEIIRKGKAGKPNEFGKLVQLQEAENQIITHYEVYEERPSDQRLLIPAVEAHQRAIGPSAALLAADAGILLTSERRRGASSRREVRIDSESKHPERAAAKTSKAALVQARAKMAHGM